MSRVSESGSTAQFYPPVPAPYFYRKPIEDVLKVGAQVDPDLLGFLGMNCQDKMPHLFELNQREPLEKTVETLCSHWRMENAGDFALKFSDRSKHYVTEENRTAITNGSVLLLSVSPVKLSLVLRDRLIQLRDLLGQLRQQPSGLASIYEQTLKYLLQSSDESAFVAEFVDQCNGLALLAQIIEAYSFKLSSCIFDDDTIKFNISSIYKIDPKTQHQPLSILWTSYWQLMETSGTSWDTISEAVVEQIANYVLGRSKSEHPKSLTAALTILEAVVNASPNNQLVVERDVPLEGLIRHLENSDSGVQQQNLALMNTLIGRVVNNQDEDRLREMAALLNSKPVRSAIVNNVLRDRDNIGVELTHQLHVLQRLILNLLDIRARTKPCLEKVNEFAKLAASVIGGLNDGATNASSTSTGSNGALSPTSNRRNQNQSSAADAKCYKRLGFMSLSNPPDDFHSTTGGSLALECLHYLAKRHPERFAKIIIENSCRTDGRDYPFVQTSVQIVSLLITMLNVGETPQNEGGTYYDVLFTHECAFEELASHAFVVFATTWKEMCALYPEDFTTVLQVVEEQISRSLNQRPRTFDQLDDILRRYGYREIAKIRENERALKEKSEFESKPVLELQEKLKPEMLLLVRENRLNGMKQGQTFAKYTRGQKGNREKGKFWHWKLSPTDQYLMYEDCEEKTPPKFEDMKNKVAISDIARIVIGAECPHVAKEAKQKKGPTTVMSFSIFLNGESGSENGCFNFLAPCMPTYNLWIDGLFALLNQPMASTQANEDVNMLLNMEVKVRLLDLENTILPSSPPPLPPPPANFNF